MSSWSSHVVCDLGLTDTLPYENFSFFCLLGISNLKAATEMTVHDAFMATACTTDLP